MPKILVLGIGNLLLTDDGVGVHAAQALMQETWPDNVTVMDGGTFTHDIFYLFKGYDHLLILDIVHAGGIAGSIYRLTEDQLVHDERQRLSIHDIDLLDSLRMAEQLHGSKPEMIVLGVEPHDYTTWSTELSAPVQAHFEEFLAVTRREIQNLLLAMLQMDDDLK